MSNCLNRCIYGKCFLFAFVLAITSNSVFADYNYQNSNGQLSIEYNEITNGKTLQTIKKDDTLIAQHCYQNGNRIKDDTPECSTTTGGGTGGGTGTGGGSGGGTTTSYTIEYSIEAVTNGHRIQLK